MSIKYADFIDPQVLTDTIGADYLNESRLINSSIVRREGAPTEGSQVEWLKQTLFSGDEEGQTVGVDTEIDLKSKSQVQYALPIVWRADGAELDDISEAIIKKSGGREGAEADASADLSNAISAKAGTMADTVGIKIIDGCAKFLVTDANNYVDNSGSQVNLLKLEETRSTRGEKGVNFEGGFMVMRGVMYHKLGALGLIAATSNTMGNMKQDELVRSGVVGTLLGMNVFPTDKIALVESDTDHYIHFIESGALRMKIGNLLDIDPVARATRAFKSSIKFKMDLGGMVDGLSWGSAKVNPATLTNTALATGTNYEQAMTNIKNVPMAVYRCDAPTFT
jgi:hypothetical protein